MGITGAEKRQIEDPAALAVGIRFAERLVDNARWDNFTVGICDDHRSDGASAVVSVQNGDTAERLVGWVGHDEPADVQ